MNAPDIAYRPILTDAARPSILTVRAVDQHGEDRDTPIPVEHPLTLYVDKGEILTLMTLGAAPEALAVGYLRNQRLLGSVDEIVSVQVDWDVDAVAVTTRHGLGKPTIPSGCGQGTVFGDVMEAIGSVKVQTDAVLTRSHLYALLDRVRERETIGTKSGAVHCCALAANDRDASDILCFVEDVGRLNAVDAIAGMMWLDRVDGGGKILYTTGRLTTELVVRTVQMGIPFLVSHSGPTQMGYDIAKEAGITMIGRATGKRFLLFTGVERFRADA